MTQIHNANHDVSAYGLACGYIQQRTMKCGAEVTLWREGGVYHVRAHNHNDGKRLFWFVNESLTKCRAIYRKGVV